MSIFDIFKRKNSDLKDLSLEEAVKKGLITEEEMLRIKRDRSEERLKKFLLNKKK